LGLHHEDTKKKFAGWADVRKSIVFYPHRFPSWSLGTSVKSELTLLVYASFYEMENNNPAFAAEMKALRNDQTPA